MKKISIVLVILMFFNSNFAQNQKSCGLSENLRKIYAENPQLELDQKAFIAGVMANSKHSKSKNKSVVTYIVPIVFHIIHEYGTENISDAQVYDQMEILNRDFQKRNSDTASVVAAFDTLIGNAEIEFRLATKDPLGNCTNGIEHIYSHNTNNGDDFSKLNQWNRAEYLNIWVVNTIGASGVAGYAYYPSTTSQGLVFADGIIILNDYIGSIGTSNPFSSRALTHEIGHYLGLPHTWGNTNEPTVACGDDGIQDTPITKGHDNCTNLNDSTCTPGVIENVQNFMEYSYCSKMFTFDQVDVMNATLSSSVANRANLGTPQTLEATGTNFPANLAPICAPVADFFTNTKTVCTGDNVTFRNASWRAGVTSFLWTFPGGSPATSTLANPVVTYAEGGYKNVTLTVTNASGSDTKNFDRCVFVSNPWHDLHGPSVQDFESNSDNWVTFNPGNDLANFEKVNGKGKNGSSCFELDNFHSFPQALPYSNDALFSNRLGGSKDYLISPSYDLSNTTNITFSFDYAYAVRSQVAADVTEKLLVYSSKDCGKTWIVRKTINLTSGLITAGFVGSTDFAPTNNSQWNNASFNFAGSTADTKTRFRFEFTSSDVSSNLFIDNVNISGLLDLTENISNINLQISPNPIESGNALKVDITDLTNNAVLQIVDMQGAIMSQVNIVESQGLQTIEIPMNVSQGCYFLNAINDGKKSTYKVIVK